MLGVLSRLAVYNGFDRLECRRLFGHAGMASFRSSAKCDPNDPAAIDLERLITMTGWTSPLLDASFSPYYDWPLTITCRSECESVQRRSDRSDRLAHKLRVCLTCARYGEHLLFHQMIDWQRCPLHLDQFTEECPVCRRLFGHYAYSLDATALVRCRGCGWQPPSASRASTARQMTRRLRIMADYDDWLYRIHAAGNRRRLASATVPRTSTCARVGRCSPPDPGACLGRALS